MSSTEVEVFPTTGSADTDVACIAPQQRVASTAGLARRVSTSPQVVYDQWVSQLMPLASQHQLSEYSRMKYGHQGCPISYRPLSFHLPNVFHELRERQTRCDHYAMWWPCPPSVLSESTLIRRAAATVTVEKFHTPDAWLQQDLSDAFSASVSRPNEPHESLHKAVCAFRVKTSETHPINISAMIPPESIHSVSSNLTRCNETSPVLFEIPLHCSLDQITGCTHTLHSSLAQLPLLPSTTVPTRLPHLHLCPPQSANANDASVRKALEAALSTTIASPPTRPALSRPLPLKRTTKSLIASEEADDSASRVTEPLTPRRSTFSLQGRHIPQPREGLFSSIFDFVPPNVVCPLQLNVPSAGPSSPRSSKSRLTTVSFASPPSPNAVPQRPFKLGNLLLSSCPGKKLRLGGPVKGRSAVCRDLALDLRRIRALGARCIICCLDDEELQFLGISWTEYYQTAHKEYLDVLRIPLPEGLAPLSPQLFDARLLHIIETYTLRGVSVHVHCRGGVGRAGLVACCWMLRLGLCGWIETDIGLGSPIPDTSDADAMSQGNWFQKTFQWDSDTVLRRDTLQLVERVIGVVRRRRSAKAIETLEQVQFLVEYVDYLRALGRK